jgi:hypothetical protein
MSPQEQHLLLCGSLQHREDQLSRVVAWDILQAPLQKLATQVTAAM